MLSSKVFRLRIPLLRHPASSTAESLSESHLGPLIVGFVVVTTFSVFTLRTPNYYKYGAANRIKEVSVLSNGIEHIFRAALNELGNTHFFGRCSHFLHHHGST